MAEADVFGQNFRPGVAEKNGFDYETLKAINPALVYVSISGYGQEGPHAHLPGTDAVGQALGGVTEAYAGPGESMRTGIVSVADESCALLAFGGLLAALHCARTTGVGQKVETSLVAGVVRLMGWTLTTTMWRGRNPITGTRINGTRERPGIAASFNDADGPPARLPARSPRLETRDGSARFLRNAGGTRCGRSRACIWCPRRRRR